MTKQPKNSEIEYLAFSDWICHIPEERSAGWTVIAQRWKDERGDLFTMSALVQGGDVTVLLNNHEWDIRPGFGSPDFEYEVTDGKKLPKLNENNKHVIGDVAISPFTISRSFHGIVPSRFDLIQSFILFHNAFFDQTAKAWKRITDDGDIQIVVREVIKDDMQCIEADTHLLKDFLASVQCSLVRYHDHRRYIHSHITTFASEEIRDRFISTATCRFDIYIGDLHAWEERAAKTFARLLGKDIVKPYTQPDKSHFWWVDDDAEAFAKYIIGRSELGELIESTCNEKVLSNFFHDRESPHFLTAIFFQKSVLAKYYDTPTRYSVDDNSVTCIGIWHLPIDITDEDLVHVWLGDLGRIPHKEQLHWRQFNVEPKGTITEHRFRRDFLAEWVEPTNNPIGKFKQLLIHVREESKSRLGEPLFLPLNEGDQHYESTVRLPLNEEWSEFDQQVQVLAKLTVDSLNVDLLRTLLGEGIDGETKSISLLEMVLRGSSLPLKERQQTIQWLRTAQNLRSISAAHRKGTNFQNALQKLGMEKLSNKDRIAKVVEGLNYSLRVITAWLEEMPSAD